VTDLVLGDERALRQAAARKQQHQRVRDEDQHLGDGHEQPADDVHRPGRDLRRGLRSLHRVRLGNDLGEHEDQERHRSGRHGLAAVAELAQGEARGERRPGDVRQQRHEQHDVEEGGRVLDDPQQPARPLVAALLVEVQRLDAADPGDRGLGHRAERGDEEQHEDDDERGDGAHQPAGSRENEPMTSVIRFSIAARWASFWWS
jgi:hypothetical protein